MFTLPVVKMDFIETAYRGVVRIGWLGRISAAAVWEEVDRPIAYVSEERLWSN
jgi:hypothetical protein